MRSLHLHTCSFSSCHDEKVANIPRVQCPIYMSKYLYVWVYRCAVVHDTCSLCCLFPAFFVFKRFHCLSLVFMQLWHLLCCFQHLSTSLFVFTRFGKFQSFLWLCWLLHYFQHTLHVFAVLFKVFVFLVFVIFVQFVVLCQTISTCVIVVVSVWCFLCFSVIF